MHIIFFGTPDFVIPVADSILKTENLKLVAVVTNPDRPVGRKQILTPSPIKSWAQQNNLKVINSTLMIHIIRVIKKIKPDLGILAAYGKIIPQEVIDLFPQGILVIHPSLLPKYRGASPIQAAILNGDKETGVSILQMDEKMDHGPILAQFKEPIYEDDTAETLTKRLFEKTAPVLIKIIKDINIIKSIEQNHSLATFTKLLTKDDGLIAWKTLASKGHALRSYNFIRAMTPWPGAWTNVVIPSAVEGSSEARAAFGLDSSTPRRIGGSVGMTKRLKILKAHLEKEKLILDEVQLEGKKPVSFSDFQKGYPEVKF